jgi:hypothetical protein
MAAVQLLGDDRPEDGVAEELQPLVRVAALVLPRGVAEHAPASVVRQRVDELREVGCLPGGAAVNQRVRR